VLIDIDHSPRHLLNPGHADFYAPDGLRRLAGGCDPAGCSRCGQTTRPTMPISPISAQCSRRRAPHVVEFDNFLTGGTSTNTVYVATRQG